LSVSAGTVAFAELLLAARAKREHEPAK
jgi:hypothetical protein